jgi:CRISPR-associated endonuclease/helicase Cas3
MLCRANGIEAHLEQLPGRVDHSTAGAQHAMNVAGPLGALLAYCIAGHHAGLPDRLSPHGQSGLDDRLAKFDHLTGCLTAVPPEFLRSTTLATPPLTIDRRDHARASFQVAFLGRMLFSCLVDADFLATEQFMSPDQSQARGGRLLTVADLDRCLDAYLAKLAQDTKPSPVNTVRAHVLSVCRAAAMQSPGLFSLTVPTGGGKTLSSLAFALVHAGEHGYERVIYGIPFTSIIEQTANVYRKVFAALGRDAVLEHHSNFDPSRETLQSRLASENWDAPLVVTTNVQLFESLFAAKTSRCRKLHRLVGSVIVLDEAQTLPIEFLRPCLEALRELVTNYRCTVVLCTATQPALHLRDGFPIGLENVREIMPDPPALYRKMKRARADYLGKRSDQELVGELQSEEQFLCIVNTRAHAARLYELLAFGTDSEGTFHLSTFMCGAHRTNVLDAIRRRLTGGQRCCVVSTSLIEAGVDVDFPLVYRALTGVDSIAQAAGRCNREGRRPEGVLKVFIASDVRLLGYLNAVAQSTAELLPDATDLLDPELVRRYFELHYCRQKGDDRWDKKRVMECFPTPLQSLHFQYRTAAERFHLIEETGRPVFVPYKKRGRRLTELLRKQPTRKLLRRLQRYSVAVFEHVYQAMLGKDIELLDSGHAVLINPDCYDNNLGFRSDKAGQHEPESLVL